MGQRPDATDDPFKAFAERRHKDRTGLGLGLAATTKVPACLDALRAQSATVKSSRNRP
jgi:hypothetical protein